MPLLWHFPEDFQRDDKNLYPGSLFFPVLLPDTEKRSRFFCIVLHNNVRSHRQPDFYSKNDRANVPEIHGYTGKGISAFLHTAHVPVMQTEHEGADAYHDGHGWFLPSVLLIGRNDFSGQGDEVQSDDCIPHKSDGSYMLLTGLSTEHSQTQLSVSAHLSPGNLLPKSAHKDTLSDLPQGNRRKSLFPPKRSFHICNLFLQKY